MLYLPPQVRPSSLSFFSIQCRPTDTNFQHFQKKKIMMQLKHFSLEILVIPLILKMSIVKHREKQEHFLQYIIHSVNPYCKCSLFKSSWGTWAYYSETCCVSLIFLFSIRLTELNLPSSSSSSFDRRSGQDIHRDFFPNTKICHRCTQVPGINETKDDDDDDDDYVNGTASQIETAVVIN